MQIYHCNVECFYTLYLCETYLINSSDIDYIQTSHVNYIRNQVVCLSVPANSCGNNIRTELLSSSFNTRSTQPVTSNYSDRLVSPVPTETSAHTRQATCSTPISSTWSLRSARPYQAHLGDRLFTHAPSSSGTQGGTSKYKFIYCNYLQESTNLFTVIIYKRYAETALKPDFQCYNVRHSCTWDKWLNMSNKVMDWCILISKSIWQ